MKQLIVTLAIFPVLLLFLLQIPLSQVNYSRAGLVKDFALAMEIQAEKEGYFSESNLSAVKSGIAAKFNIDPEDVLIEAAPTEYSQRKFKSPFYSPANLLHYKLTVPVERLVAGGGYYGIGAADNRGVIVVERYLQSEVLAP